MTHMKETLTKDTVIKTNLLTIITVVCVVVTAFVSYTVAIDRVKNTEDDVKTIQIRLEKLEDANQETQKLLVQISTDVRYLRENR